MKIWDPHVHMYARTTDDYEKMALAGIRAICEPAFWLGEPRKYAGSFFDYFDHLCNFETARSESYGIAHYVLLCMNPREANDTALAEEVVDALPRYLAHPQVVAVGEIGFDDITPAEEKAIRRQARIAADMDLPIMVHLPHRDKIRGTERTIKVMQEMQVHPDKVILDHNTEETIKMTRDAGFWAGHTVYPVSKMSAQRTADILMQFGTDRMMVNSAADWGPSDPLSVPRTILAMEDRGFRQEEIQKIVWDNPRVFFSQSGKVKLS